MATSEALRRGFGNFNEAIQIIPNKIAQRLEIDAKKKAIANSLEEAYTGTTSPIWQGWKALSGGDNTGGGSEEAQTIIPDAPVQVVANPLQETLENKTSNNEANQNGNLGMPEQINTSLAERNAIDFAGQQGNQVPMLDKTTPIIIPDAPVQVATNPLQKTLENKTSNNEANQIAEVSKLKEVIRSQNTKDGIRQNQPNTFQNGNLGITEQINTSLAGQQGTQMPMLDKTTPIQNTTPNSTYGMIYKTANPIINNSVQTTTENIVPKKVQANQPYPTSSNNTVVSPTSLTKRNAPALALSGVPIVGDMFGGQQATQTPTTQTTQATQATQTTQPTEQVANSKVLPQRIYDMSKERTAYDDSVSDRAKKLRQMEIDYFNSDAYNNALMWGGNPDFDKASKLFDSKLSKSEAPEAKYHYGADGSIYVETKNGLELAKDGAKNSKAKDREWVKTPTNDLRQNSLGKIEQRAYYRDKQTGEYIRDAKGELIDSWDLSNSGDGGTRVYNSINNAPNAETSGTDLGKMVTAQQNWQAYDAQLGTNNTALANKIAELKKDGKSEEEISGNADIKLYKTKIGELQKAKDTNLMYTIRLATNNSNTLRNLHDEINKIYGKDSGNKDAYNYFNTRYLKMLKDGAITDEERKFATMLSNAKWGQQVDPNAYSSIGSNIVKADLTKTNDPIAEIK
jgi:hypothetical protein